MLLLKDKIDKMDRNSNVYKNYITFKNMIQASLDSGLDLSDILAGIKKLEVVEIILDKQQGDEPQKIFESINSTGLELSLADLIRNYLLMDDAKQDELYEEYWLEIEKNVGYRNLGDFVINFLNSQVTKSVNSKNAYRIFKVHCEEKDFSHEDILIKLRRTSKYYGAFIGENNHYNAKIMKYLRSLSAIKQTTVIPFLFKIFDDFEDDHISEDTLCKVLDYLLTYFVRITACEINKNLSKFMRSLYDRIFDGTYTDYYERFVIFLNGLRANDRMPTDEEFLYALTYKPLYTKPICKFVLSVIENSTKEHIDVSDLTIEHILPQKENSAVWRKEVGEAYSHVYESYLHTLGNLTITGHNSELGTKPFNDKKKIIQANSKANILNREVLSADTWNEEAILNRARVLSAILIKAFAYVEMRATTPETSYLSFGVNSDTDFSDTKPDGFVFIGEYIKVGNWADLLTKFISTAYDLDAGLFAELAARNYSIPNATRVYITNDARQLRKGKQIENSGIYFEMNLSANGIISFIKDLLLKLQLDADDFSFSLAEVPFSATDESSWETGAVAKLFFNFVETLIADGRITAEEIERLKTKEYTKTVFAATDYPALANSVDDNKGNSTHRRYRAKALKFDDTPLYVCTQFFESERDAVIEWYKSHLA